jgi:hypothetical protein
LVEKRQNVWGKTTLVSSSLFAIGEINEASAGHSERRCMRKRVRLGTNYLRSEEFNNFLMQLASNKQSQYNIVMKYSFI